MDGTTRLVIVRIATIRKKDTVVLKGKDGRTMTVSDKNVALCFIPDINGEVDLAMSSVPKEHPC